MMVDAVLRQCVNHDGTTNITTLSFCLCCVVILENLKKIWEYVLLIVFR
jgi:hypothetical protein